MRNEVAQLKALADGGDEGAREALFDLAEAGDLESLGVLEYKEPMVIAWSDGTPILGTFGSGDRRANTKGKGSYR